MEIVNSRHKKDEQKKSPKPLKRILRITFGVFFLALGIIGIFLPILQGIFFIVIGLLLLAPYNKFIRRHMDTFKKKHPKLYQRAQALKRKFRRGG